MLLLDQPWPYTVEVDMCMCPYRRHNYQTLPQNCQLSEITAMNAIGADTAASSSLVSKAANDLPTFGSQR